MRIVLMLLLAGMAYGQQGKDDVQVLHVRGPIYMIAAGGGNITAWIGPDGVLLVDTGTAEMSDKVKATIRDLQKQVSIMNASIPRGGADTRTAAQALRTPPPPPG